ncbi:unnamed protein product [Litomosoides sigmodontis]|uniref:Uncharacterized protein n=1 Tax=Litomosoides sigmodontis TaxID=42156 RepID=A0A3P6V3J3_LITSI|nr:unnamed protein product [Litomosoides sigmodontis]
MAKAITDDQYMAAVHNFFNQKLKQFQEAGGWDVINEKAQHCTYHRYLESGAEDCENTAKLIESLMLVLQAVKCEMQAEIERLEARQFERTNFAKMVEVIDSVTKNTENISESCTKNTNMDEKRIERMDKAIPPSSKSIINLEAQVSGLQIAANTSKNNRNSTFKQEQREPNETFAEKLCRPPATLSGSFTADRDENTLTFLEPVHVLSFQDTTMDDTVRNKDNLDQISDSLKEDVGLARVRDSPVVESEFTKQWIREVAFEQGQRKPTETLIEKLLYRPPTSLTGSFTVDQDEDSATFLEPVRILTLQDTITDDTRSRDSVDQRTDNFKKKDIELAHISEPPAMESELTKRWIREVAFRQEQDKDTATFYDPVRLLTSQNGAVNDTERGDDNPDQRTKRLKKCTGSVCTSQSLVMESELAKQWIREVDQEML